MEKNLRDRILGCLSMGAIGDALGARTENMAYEQVAQRYGRPSECFADALSLKTMDNTLTVSSYTKDIIEQIRNSTTEESGKQEETTPLVQSRTAKLHELYQTWGSLVENVQRSRESIEEDAAVTAVCAGLLNPGQIDNAIQDACMKYTSKQSSSAAYAGAGAIAAGISQALVDTDVMSVYRACLYGAREGGRYGKAYGYIVPGASVEARIRLAMQISVENNFEDVNESIVGLLGSSSAACEAVPAAIGHFLGARGDPVESVSSAMSCGGASRVISSITGQLSGALRGINRCPKELQLRIDHKNALWLSGWSDIVLQSLKSKYPAIALLCINA